MSHSPARAAQLSAPSIVRKAGPTEGFVRYQIVATYGDAEVPLGYLSAPAGGASEDVERALWPVADALVAALNARTKHLPPARAALHLVR